MLAKTLWDWFHYFRFNIVKLRVLGKMQCAWCHRVPEWHAYNSHTNPSRFWTHLSPVSQETISYHRLRVEFQEQFKILEHFSFPSLITWINRICWVSHCKFTIFSFFYFLVSVYFGEDVLEFKQISYFSMRN